MLSKNNGKLELIKDSGRFSEYHNIECWVENKNNFDTHIFTIILENEKELEQLWGMINRDIALYFQTKLTKDIERWNIYIVFFVKNKVSVQLKYTIEQDKYSARKIVIDEVQIPEDCEDFVKTTINDKIFDIKIENEKPTTRVSLSDIIKNMSEELYKIVRNNEYDKNKAVEDYLRGDNSNETEEN